MPFPAAGVVHVTSSSAKLSSSRTINFIVKVPVVTPSPPTYSRARVVNDA